MGSGFWPSSRRRAGWRITAVGVMLVGVSAVSTVGLSTLEAGPAHAAVGAPFSCSSEIDFLSQGDPDTQLYEGTYGSGTATYTKLGAAQPEVYNALGYDPTNNYLYGTYVDGENTTGYTRHALPDRQYRNVHVIGSHLRLPGCVWLSRRRSLRRVGGLLDHRRWDRRHDGLRDQRGHIATGGDQNVDAERDLACRWTSPWTTATCGVLTPVSPTAAKSHHP